jgi:nitrate reductase beta subunit
MGGSGPFGESSGGPAPIAVENFHMLRDRQTADTVAGPAGKAGRVNLLNWDGKGRPAGLFPPAAPPDSPPETPPEPGGGLDPPPPAPPQPGGGPDAPPPAPPQPGGDPGARTGSPS